MENKTENTSFTVAVTFCYNGKKINGHITYSDSVRRFLENKDKYVLSDMEINTFISLALKGNQIRLKEKSALLTDVVIKYFVNNIPCKSYGPFIYNYIQIR